MDDKQGAEFGAWLRKHREALGIKQAEAGRRAKMSRTQWTRLELGESGTKRSNIPLIAKAVNANLYETYRLAGFDPPKDPAGGFTKSKFESLYHRVNQLKPEQRKELAPLIEMLEREVDRLARKNNPKLRTA